uniref:histidine kinase n=1 Tax=Phenylobacterium glaciei TaxID=2803784 RepID=A0A974P2Y1_9CAUL|nr:PAS domain-containing protein [Phenylobacterium glaciei]
MGGVLVVCTETTQQVLGRRRAVQEREDFARLFDQSPTFMATLIGPEHRFDLVNPSYRQLIGNREVLGKTLADALPDAVAQGYLDLLDEVYRSGVAHRAIGSKYVFQADPTAPPTERFIDFVYQPITDEEGAVTGIFVEGADVTERTKIEAELREEEARFRTLADNIPTLCWMAEPDGDIFWYNSQWYEYTGMSAEDQLGWGWASVHDPEVLPAVAARWQDSLDRGEPFEMTFPSEGRTASSDPS